MVFFLLKRDTSSDEEEHGGLFWFFCCSTASTPTYRVYSSWSFPGSVTKNLTLKLRLWGEPPNLKKKNTFYSTCFEKKTLFIFLDLKLNVPDVFLPLCETENQSKSESWSRVQLLLGGEGEGGGDTPWWQLLNSLSYRFLYLLWKNKSKVAVQSR